MIHVMSSHLTNYSAFYSFLTSGFSMKTFGGLPLEALGILLSSINLGSSNFLHYEQCFSKLKHCFCLVKFVHSCFLHSFYWSFIHLCISLFVDSFIYSSIIWKELLPTCIFCMWLYIFVWTDLFVSVFLFLCLKIYIILHLYYIFIFIYIIF